MAPIWTSYGVILRTQPLAYARIDLRRGKEDSPQVLGLEISEAPLPLTFAAGQRDALRASLGRFTDRRRRVVPQLWRDTHPGRIIDRTEKL